MVSLVLVAILVGGFFFLLLDFLWIRRRWDCFGVVDSQKDMDVSKSGSSNRYRIKTCI